MSIQQCENVRFFLRGYPMIFVKNWTFLLSLIFFEKDLDIMFKYVLNKKNFLDYKNRKKGLSMILVKNWTFLLSPIFFEKD